TTPHPVGNISRIDKGTAVPRTELAFPGPCYPQGGEGERSFPNARVSAYITGTRPAGKVKVSLSVSGRTSPRDFRISPTAHSLSRLGTARSAGFFGGNHCNRSVGWVTSASGVAAEVPPGVPQSKVG